MPGLAEPIARAAGTVPEALGDRAWVEVDLENLAANARQVLAASGGAALLGVVKADAYGLGAAVVARALQGLSPWGFAVATVEEGLQLREAGITRPVLVLTPARPELARAYEHGRLRAVLDDPGLAPGWPEPYHVEIDTGMSRCGVPWDDRDALGGVAAAGLEGVFTHFHSADEDPSSVARQWRRFEAALESMGTRPRLVHAANSAGVWRLGRPLDLVRPGIHLYGGQPAADLPEPRPVVAVRARVVTLRRLRAGETVSYGASWTAPADTVVATLGLGYADGYPRSVQGKASVLLGGRRHPVVGRVTMDMTMIDVGDAPVRVGDVATVLGRQGTEEILLNDLASWSGTISYEVLTRLSPRLPRYYLGSPGGIS